MDERLQPVVLTAVAVGLGFAVAAALRQSAQPLPDARSAGSLAATARFESVRVVGRAAGRRAWVLTAPVVTSPQGRDKLEFAGGVQATLYQDDQPRVVCDAPSAHYDGALQTLVVRGGVTLRLQPPSRASDDDLPAALGTITLKTASLEWKIGEKTLVCDQPVIGTFRNGEVRTRRLRLNLQTRAFDGSPFAARYLVKDLNL